MSQTIVDQCINRAASQNDLPFFAHCQILQRQIIAP